MGLLCTTETQKRHWNWPRILVVEKVNWLETEIVITLRGEQYRSMSRPIGAFLDHSD
jgi:hypothetical protein